MPHHSTPPDRRRVLSAAALSLFLPSAARAQGAAPIRLVVPFTPGTGVDILARQVAPHLSQRLGRPVVVDNKPGASGNLGAAEVVRAAPDGSTLLVSVNTLVINRALYPKAGFDPLKDLEPIALASWGDLLLVASTKSGIDSAAQLLEQARARPGSLNYGSPGAGTPHHLAMELLKNQARVSITHVPYKGTGGAVTDLLGGTLDVMFLPIHVALPHVKAGSLKALAISSDKPNPLLPNVPPLRSLNLGELEVDMWYGLLAPRGTPKDFVERVNGELKTILALPEVKTAFESQGMTPTYSTPEQMRAQMAKDAARWAQLIKAQNISAQ